MRSSFRAIRIKSHAEFEWLIEHLTNEAFRVRDHWELWGALDGSLDQYSLELNQTPNFWELTRRVYKDAVILRLGRLFDPDPSSISLGNLLQTTKENAVAPSTPLPSAVAGLNLSELDQEMYSVSGRDPTVKKLLKLRNEYMAHRGSQHVSRGTFKSLPVLERDEIATMLNRALDITQKYRKHLGFPSLLWGSYEVRDFETLLELLRAGRS
jgi:hypothetical protein